MAGAGESQKVSLSIGLARSQGAAQIFTELYQAAGAAMYREKQWKKGASAAEK